MPTFKPYTQHQLERMLFFLRDAVYTPLADLEITAWRTREPVPFRERFKGEELHLKPGDKWGDLFDCAWFRFRGAVPEAAASKNIVLLLDVSGEMCVVDEAGNPLRGLTTVSSEYDFSLGMPGKRVFPLCNFALPGAFEIWADAGCNDLFGNLQRNGEVREARIAILNETLRGLYYDVEVLMDALNVLPESSARREQILTALNDVMHLLMGEIGETTAIQARRILAPILAKRGGDPSLQISAIGHAHIDLAWLWPLRETKRKGLRTFATALANMDLYPDYRFAASQAQLFAWMKEADPVLYGRIRDAVAAGRLEPQGALWVECDTNVTGGESLIRQILYGRRFFRQEFGVDVPYVWLPDTFGYSGALPQIMKKAGIKYFSTQKLSWSLINAFPHQSFHWRGIDGSSVLVHMLPEETYNSPAAPRSLSKIEANYRDRGVSQYALMVFGIGDGGGGPGEEHLERLERLKNFAGLPPVKQEWTIDFFRKWETEADRFAVWAGELYLERHEGTLTTHGRNKRFNRLMEQGLRDLEWLSLLAETLAGTPYPSDFLEKTWRETLLYQFHDILPGSSIKRVYDETTPRYQAMLAEVQERASLAAAALAQKVNTAGMAKPAIVFNALPWKRCEWLKLDEQWRMVEVPPMGYTAVDTAYPADPPNSPLIAEVNRLENDRLAVQFNGDGTIASIWDKQAQRQVLTEGAKGNQFAVYGDLGDAWDFPMDYAESQPRRMKLTSAQATTDGPRAVLVQEYELGHSSLKQEISLVQGSARLEFNTQIRWREIRSMLRVSFPLAVHATEAACEIQFGHIRRTTHRNTTWDLARDEVAAQKWVDISQGDYGTALLNDCKYGHKVKDNILDLNLLRSVPYPGPRLVQDADVAPGQPHDGYTDQTDHVVRYALYPHAGNLVEGGVIQAAYAFNYPLRVVKANPAAGSLPQEKSFLSLDDSAIVIETVKKAEDSRAWIVRMYESTGSQVRTKLRIGVPVRSAQEVDLMEEPICDLTPADDGLELVFQPFEIKTIRMI